MGDGLKLGKEEKTCVPALLFVGLKKFEYWQAVESLGLRHTKWVGDVITIGIEYEEY